MKLGTVIFWASLHSFFSEFYNFDFLNFLMNCKIFVEIATFTVLNGVHTSMHSDYSEVYGSISLKLCMKKVKQIFDIIQNGGLAAIFDVNTLGAITWRISLDFVQTWFRETV